MIDFNAHLLSGFSDGPESSEKSYALLRELIGVGFDRIVCAPRYFAKNNEYVSLMEKRQRIGDLETRAKMDGLKVKLFLANEVFLATNIDEMVQKGEISILKKNYLLIKLPERGKISLKKVEDVLVDLRSRNYVPILANPERSTFLQEDFVAIDKLSGTGAMFQCGFGSVIGLNGRDAEKLMKYMLERGFVDFLGTDVHQPGEEVILKFEKAKKRIEKIIGIRGFEKIMRNAEGVL